MEARGEVPQQTAPLRMVPLSLLLPLVLAAHRVPQLVSVPLLAGLEAHPPSHRQAAQQQAAAACQTVPPAALPLSVQQQLAAQHLLLSAASRRRCAGGQTSRRACQADH